METPLAMDAFSRVMAEVYDESAVIPNDTAFTRLFGNPALGGRIEFVPNALAIDIDIIRGEETLAATVLRGSESLHLDIKETNIGKSTSESRVFPLIEEVGPITTTMIQKRIAGEAVNSNVTQQDRMLREALRIKNKHIQRIVRTNEFLASQSILTGLQPAIIGTTNTNLIYDFKRKAGNTITVSTGWNQGGATIADDIDNAAEVCRTNGKMDADMMILGGDAMDSFIKDSDVQARSDNRRFELILVNDKNPVPDRFASLIGDGGLKARGRYMSSKGHELWMFTYTGEYTDSSAATQKFMPADKVIIMASRGRKDQHLGPQDRLPLASLMRQMYEDIFGFDITAPAEQANVSRSSNILIPEALFTDAIIGVDGKTVSIRSQYAPIYPTVATDTIVVLDGLET